MSKKKNTLSIQDITNNLIDRYNRWKHIYLNGCSDPFWEDGVNINLVRNHILYYKRLLEETLRDNFIGYPDVYYFPEPPELPYNFMAKDRKTATKGELKCNKTCSYEDILKFDWKYAFN